MAFSWSQDAAGALVVVDQHALGDLDLQPGRIDRPVSARTVATVSAKSSLAELHRADS